MILYGITINIDRNHHNQWLDWTKKEYLPIFMNTGLIKEHRILKLLNEEEGNPGITYSIQLLFKNLSELERFQQEFEPELDTLLYSRYRNHLVDFRTVLEVIE